jgi:hypothetical protein
MPLNNKTKMLQGDNLFFLSLLKLPQPWLVTIQNGHFKNRKLWKKNPLKNQIKTSLGDIFFPFLFQLIVISFHQHWGVKLIYFEKATNFCEISTVDLSYVVTVKSTMEILQNFVAFSENMNFNNSKVVPKILWLHCVHHARDLFFIRTCLICLI